MDENDVITYVINLDSSTDRLAAVQKELAKANIDFIRVPAFDGRHLDIDAVEDYDDERTIKLFGRSLNGGEIGCYKSHINCLERFLASDAKYGLVLEDDINLESDTLASISKAVSFLDQNEPDWYVIHLAIPLYQGECRRRYSHLYTLDNERSLLAAHRFPYGALGLLWSRKGAQLVLDKAHTIKMPIDELSQRVMSYSGRGFAIYPPLVLNTDVKSDIDDSMITRLMMYTKHDYTVPTSQAIVRKQERIYKYIGYLYKINFIRKRLQRLIIARIRNIINIQSF